MNTYKININRTEVLNEVSEHSAYIGAKTSDYDRAAALEEDEHFLSKLFDKCSSAFVGSLKEFVSDSWKSEGGVFSFSVQLPNVFPSELSSELINMSYWCLVEMVLSEWLAVLSRTDAAYYKNAADKRFFSLWELLHHKRRPRRERFK